MFYICYPTNVSYGGVGMVNYDNVSYGHRTIYQNFRNSRWKVYIRHTSTIIGRRDYIASLSAIPEFRQCIRHHNLYIF